MFYVKVENYSNDFDKYYEDLRFSDLDSLKNYLIKENSKRDDTPKNSKYWSSPCGVMKSNNDDNIIYRGWFRTKRNSYKYSLWLKQVKFDNVIVFEENNYCSKKFYDFLVSLKEEFEKEEIYGDF